MLVTHTRRTWAAVALAAVTTIASAGIAAADAISNDLDDSVDAVAEVMALNVGGPVGTTDLYVPGGVEFRNGDGKNGCNLTGGTTLVVSVASSDTDVATVALTSATSPTTFGSCGDVKEVTVTPVATGTATITVSQVSNNTGGTFNFAPATFTVDVAPATPSNTAPTIEITGVTAGGAYPVGSVPVAMCEVTDAEDDNSSFAASLSTAGLDADGLGPQTASCTYTDGGGLTASASVTYSIVDPSPPVVGYTLNGSHPGTPDGLLGWWKGNVTLDWTVTEPQSPSSLVLTGCTDVTVSADQLPTTYSCSATSSGGSSGAPVTVSVKRDGNGPVVSYTSASGTPGTGGWYVSPVTATFTATDAFSGPASQTGTATSTSDGAAVVLNSPAFTDNAGNTTAAGAATSPAFKIDTVAPDVPTFVDGPDAGSSHYFGSVPAAPECDSDDATSLLADCVVTGYSTAVGSHTMTATATDNAGNTSTATRSYTVLAWTAYGFYRPVDMGGVVNSVKAGSTVPLKFELFAGPTELTDVAAIDSFVVREYTCQTGADLDALEEYTTGGTSLRYDPSGGQFIQNWKVPAGANRCYRATMTADDGTALTALFKTR